MQEAIKESSTSRRAFLGTMAVALPAIAAAPMSALAATEPDPVFALIEAYRGAAAANASALDEQTRLELIGDLGPLGWYEPATIACYAHNDAFWALIETNPTTFAGVVALLTFLNELAESSDAWLFVDSGALILPFISNLAQALPRLAVSSFSASTPAGE